MFVGGAQTPQCMALNFKHILKVLSMYIEIVVLQQILQWSSYEKNHGFLSHHVGPKISFEPDKVLD